MRLTKPLRSPSARSRFCQVVVNKSGCKSRAGGLSPSAGRQRGPLSLKGWPTPTRIDGVVLKDGDSNQTDHLSQPDQCQWLVWGPWPPSTPLSTGVDSRSPQTGPTMAFIRQTGIIQPHPHPQNNCACVRTVRHLLYLDERENSYTYI